MTIAQNIIRSFLIVFLAYSYAYAQDAGIKFERIGREQGLTASSVLSILQDRQGFMWFGTLDGLFRFDGYSMTAYKHDPLDSTSLGNNQVFVVLEDHTGTLWLGTAGGGLNRFDRTTEQFTRFKHDPNNPNSLSADVVSALYEDRSGSLWVGTWAGLNKLDLDTGRITRFVHDSREASSMNSFWIRAIGEDSLGAIWAGTDGGISRLDPETGKFTHFVENWNDPYGLSSNAVNAVFRDRAGTMWIGTWGGLDRFDHKTRRFANFRAGGRVSSICEDRTGALWVGTQNHLLHFDKATNRFTRFVHDPTNPNSVSSNTIQTIYENRTGVLWIGTNNGVNRLDRGQYRFKHLMHDPDDANSLSHRSVSTIHEGPTGALWIAWKKNSVNGIEVGLDKLDRHTGQIERIFANLGNDDVRRRSEINDIYQGRSGVLWLGLPAGLGRYDPETKQFKLFEHDPNDPHSLSGNFVWRIHEDQTGTLWVGINKDGPTTGIDRFDREQGRFSRIEFVQEISSGRNQRNGVHSISEGQSGRLWFATMNYGIFALNPGSNELIQFNHEPDNPNSLSHGWVGVVHEDREGILWAAPWYGGLNKLDPETGQVTIYTEKHGLASNYITSILEDDHGRIWLTTLNGLSRFDPRSATFKNFDYSDGLLHTKYDLWNVSTKSRTGELFFGGENGVDYVQPDSIRDNPHLPPVVFTRFVRYNSSEASGQAIIEKGVTEKRRFDLTHEDHTLTFEFAALNYRAPHKNQYAYKLEGFHDDWIHLGNKHEVTLTNLDPGEYTLRVKGSNNDGVWNEEGAALVINISPPWWRTGWAYTVYVTLFGLALYGLRRFELRRTQLQNELEKKDFEAQKLQEVDQMKSRFFADISHEFRTPLTLMLGPVEKILPAINDKERREDLRVMQRNARRLQRLVEQLLDLSRIEARRMPLRARPDDIVPKIREWVASFVSLAESKNITMNLHFPEQPLIAYFDAEKLEKIVYNLLSNAFKFTPEGGEITVAVGSSSGSSSSNGSLELSVGDSGIGIPKDHLPHIFDRFYRASEALTGEQGGTGIGLALTKEFVELHHGEIRVESEVGKGSTFTVVLPLGREHLSDDEVVEHVADEKLAEPSRQPLEPLHAEPAIEPDEPSATAESGRPFVLIVEDNDDMRRYLRNSLNPDFEIVEAENGEAGYQVACKKTPDLIVSDVMMPIMDGFALCEKLKTDQRTSHIPVILLTARAGQEDKLEGLEIGADDYLTKPFDARELQIRVKNLIAQRQRLRERFSREMSVQPKDITVTSIDEKFLQQALDIVEENISDSDFQIEQFCRAIGMSRSTLNRKLRALTGLSTNVFIRTLRLKRAAQLLEKKSATIVEIAYEVGFNNPSYFAECFRQQFGKPPSEYTSR
ncbi:response regulator [bacterium]|nr:response regulator [bacterium]